jgi:hypothetical protein
LLGVGWGGGGGGGARGPAPRRVPVVVCVSACGNNICACKYVCTHTNKWVVEMQAHLTRRDDHQALGLFLAVCYYASLGEAESLAPQHQLHRCTETKFGECAMVLNAASYN